MAKKQYTAFLAAFPFDWHFKLKGQIIGNLSGGPIRLRAINKNVPSGSEHQELGLDDVFFPVAIKRLINYVWFYLCD